jgi:hypothetical protein
MSLVTAAVSGWMLVMYLVLQHPGYHWRAALAGAICVGALSLIPGRPWPPLRLPSAAWGVALTAVGLWALRGGQDDAWATIAAVVFVIEGTLAAAAAFSRPNRA